MVDFGAEFDLARYPGSLELLPRCLCVVWPRGRDLVAAARVRICHCSWHVNNIVMEPRVAACIATQNQRLECSNQL